MRVLHISRGKVYGGLETLLVTLARQRSLCPAMEPEFALCFDGRLRQELEATAAPVHMLGHARVSRPISTWKARRALARLLAGGRYDVAVCHLAWAQAIFGPVVRRAGVPLIFWLHGATSGRHWLERWARLTSPDLAICNSTFTAGFLPNLYNGIPAAVLHNPVMAPPVLHNPGRSAVRAETNTREDTVVIIQVSRMEHGKGHRVHIEALAQLKDLPNWICWQVGGAQGPAERRYIESLVELAEARGIKDRIRFVGQRSDVWRLLQAADVFCQPNTEPEGFGLCFVEALYAGLPVITAAFGSAKEVLNGSCAILVPPGDVRETASALRALILNSRLRLKLSEAAPRHAIALGSPNIALRKLHSYISEQFATARTLSNPSAAES